MRLDSRTVLVTGAARGLGRELTRQLILRGADVVAAGRDRDRLDALAADHPGRVWPWPVDLSDPGAVDGLVQELPVRYPALSVAINNAGVQTVTDLLTDDPDFLRHAFRRELGVNLDAVIAISTGLLPHLSRQPEAAIVTITSGLALAPKRSAPVYCATKAGVRAFTRALRYQCQVAAPHVQVTDAVLPLVDTDMTRGRGRGKMSAADAADAVLRGVHHGTEEVAVGKVKLLRSLMRVSPRLGYRVLRDG